ncbi:hypothetical protein ACIQ1J_13445 [Streptomyces sp. NPDC097107]|uniref:hypothetical protein n=1 Tax=Streptomyces sp. NPDC097107 TaxID=3366089 RepID=UPI0038044A31
MRYIESASPRDMEIFLTGLASELLSIRAKVIIDLYVDESIADERTQEAFGKMKEAATRESSVREPRRFSRRRDPFMGMEVDLVKTDAVAHFSLLAHRVINAEAWCGENQVFGTVESPVKVWVDMDDETVDKLIASASVAGAAVRG